MTMSAAKAFGPSRFDLAEGIFHRQPEKLVGFGFRYWTLGCQSGDIDCWAEAWSLYREALGCKGASLAVSQLSSWVKSVNHLARRRIDVGPLDLGSPFGRDERLAITMVAACQHDCPALRACAFALVESSIVDELMHTTESFGTVMRSLGQMLAPPQLAAASLLAGDDVRRLMH
jgi:hypothetical protein